MKEYHALTNRGQALRLRKLALQALAQYDLHAVRVRLISNSFNGIFRVDLAGGGKLVLRVTLPEGGHTRAGTQAEMAWLDALSRQTSLRVPRPVASRSADWVVEATAPGVPEPRLCTLFEWVPGRNLAATLTEENLEKLGVLLAQLHQHAAVFLPPSADALPRYESVFHYPEPAVLFEERFAHLFTAHQRALYQQAQAWAQQMIERLQASGEPMRILHGDLHQYNVRVQRGVLAPIDFEDLLWGWPVQDIGTTLYYLGFKDLESRKQAVRRGYEQHLPWPERQPGEVEAFMASRALMLVNFAVQDPNNYWREQVPAFIQRNGALLKTLLERSGM